MIGRADKNGPQGSGVNEDVSFTLNATDRHAVAFDEADLAAGVDCRNCTENGDICGTLQAHNGGGYSLNCTHPVRIDKTVRRLMPTECSRLQGMPSWWTSDVPHSDTAEYKLWGNGMALPCVLYIMQNIADVYREEGYDLSNNVNQYLALPENMNSVCIAESET